MRSFARIAGPLAVLSLAVVALAVTAGNDSLAAHSGPHVLAVLIATMVVGVGLLLATLTAVASAIPPIRRALPDLLPQLASLVLAAAALAAVVDWWSGGAPSAPAFWARAAAGFVVLLIVARPVLCGAEVLRRVRAAGLMIAAACLLLVTVAATASLFQPASSTEGRHVVLVVIDNFPTQFLRTYTPAATATAMDRLAARGRVYGQVRTAKTWTQGFFSVLYSGSRDGMGGGPSFWRQLQDQGVAVRWIAFHNNGVPEAAGVSDYRGLRASLLTDRLAWLPRLVGLDYNLMLYLGASMRGELSAREAVAYEALNTGGRRANAFLEVMVPEALRLQASSDRSLLVFHVVNHLGEQDPNWQSSGQGEMGDFISRVSAADYGYWAGDEEDEPLVAQIALRTRDAIDRAGALLDDALRALEAAAAHPVTVVVTGDHGSAFADGRIWYGYHPDDEVTRVPLFVVGPRHSGRDDRPLGTLNLARGLATLVGASVRIDGDPVSLFEDRPAGVVTTLTLRSEQRREWFLLLHGEDSRLRVNLHPQSAGEVVGRGPANEALVDQVRHAIGAYGLDRAQIHESFR